MARAICGVCHRSGAGAAANPDTIGVMLAELPGLGCAGRIDGDAVSFGFQAPWADDGEEWKKPLGKPAAPTKG